MINGYAHQAALAEQLNPCLDSPLSAFKMGEDAVVAAGKITEVEYYAFDRSLFGILSHILMGLPVQFGMKPLRFEQLFRAFYCTLLDVKGDHPAFITHKLAKKSGVIAPPCRGVDADIPFTDIFGDILMNQCQCVHCVSSHYYSISIP